VVASEGVQLSIPMPGHPPAGPAQEAAQQADAARLDQLVQAHDVVFLLTDTRESRWLPSLLCAAHGKVRWQQPAATCKAPLRPQLSGALRCTARRRRHRWQRKGRKGRPVPGADMPAAAAAAAGGHHGSSGL
jgi:hypothetical protein